MIFMVILFFIVAYTWRRRLSLIYAGSQMSPMTNNPLPFACFVAICTLTFAPLSEAQTLEQSVHLMLQQEPELRAVDFDSKSSFQDYKIARGDLFPQVTLNGSSGVSERDRSTDGLVSQSGDTLWSNQVGLSIRQLLFDGGTVSNEVRASSAFYDAQRYLQMSQIEARVVDLAEVYLETIRVGRQVKAARENVAVHKEMREKLAERQRNGGVRADTSLIDGRLSLAENSLYTQELAMENARWRFKRLTGVEPSNITEPASLKTGSSLSELDVTQNWDYLAATSALEAADFKRQSKRGLYSPNVYLDAGASRGEDTLGVRGRDDEVRALLVLSWDLYRGGANKATNHRERLQLAKAGELLRAADQQREYQLRLLLAEKEGSRASTGSLEQYVDKLGRVIADYEEQFRIGQKELLNILDVRNEHYQARSRLIDSRFNQDVADYRMLGAQGRLVERLIGDSVADYVTVGNRRADKWYPHPQTEAADKSKRTLIATSEGTPVGNQSQVAAQLTVTDTANQPAESTPEATEQPAADEATEGKDEDEEYSWPSPFPPLKPAATDTHKVDNKIPVTVPADETGETVKAEAPAASEDEPRRFFGLFKRKK